jgi:hypothetical protein
MQCNDTALNPACDVQVKPTGVYIMQAIITKYLPVTNSRGSRIKATCAAGSVTIGYPHELSGMACHAAAAKALVDKLGWNDAHYGCLMGGQLASGDYVFVFNNDSSKV